MQLKLKIHTHTHEWVVKSQSSLQLWVYTQHADTSQSHTLFSMLSRQQVECISSGDDLGTFFCLCCALCVCVRARPLQFVSVFLDALCSQWSRCRTMLHHQYQLNIFQLIHPVSVALSVTSEAETFMCSTLNLLAFDSPHPQKRL